jgi:Zn-dependent M28 family amino/carboxypeptidase
VEGVRRIGERLVDRDVTLVAFAAEEIKLVGSRYYVDEARLRGELAHVLGVVNLDCIARGDALMLLASPDELRGRALETARALGLAERYTIEPGPATGGVDSHWFADAKVPAATICHFPYDEYHLPDDLPELVDERVLADSVDLGVALVESQLARPVGR